VHSDLTTTGRPHQAPIQSTSPSTWPARSAARHPVVVHLAVLLGYIAVGVGVTWPHATYLAGKLPYTRDAGSYVWGFWWIAHCVSHLQDPWATKYIAAPVGAPLGMHALMPLVGVVMLPVTFLFGPSASYNLISTLLPGLLAYAMYRVARLWLPSQVGAIAAGAFFGYSSILSHQTWVHLNLAAGALFLPITLEAAIRLRRRPRPRQAIALGLALAASIMVDQESTVLALILAALVLLPWLLAAPVSASTPAATAGLTDEPGPAPDHAAPPGPAEPSPAPLPDDRTREDHPSRPRRRWPIPKVLRAPQSLNGQLSPLGIPWIKLQAVGLAAAVALIVAAPQLIAIVHADEAGLPSTGRTAGAYLKGIALPDMFLPSPRITSFGLTILHARDYSTFGVVATLLALTGFILARRQRNARLLGLLFLGAAVLSLGSDINLHSGGTITPLPLSAYGVKMSLIMPYTYFVRLPGLSGFREPSRIAVLGLIPIALLAGYAVTWLRYHARVLLVGVLALGILEAGMGTPPGATTMPTSFPALDRPIAADHSASIVLDVPFGLRGGSGMTGMSFVPQTQVLATADGHPLADALLSRVPIATVKAIWREPFYRALLRTQRGHYKLTRAQWRRAIKNAIHMHIGWILLWVYNKHLRHFLVSTGFRYIYRADGASVWRPVGYATPRPPHSAA
jgi:hypothetical protein